MSRRAGEWVEVRSAAEITATLDQQGDLDRLPFMPEMLQFCGRRFRVYKSAHKTCDTIEHYKGRRMTNAVHLEGVRCDGAAHGGCQAGCLLFWKEAWLKPVPGSRGNDLSSQSETQDPLRTEALTRATRSNADGTRTTYRCQATEMLRATRPLAWWDPRQYIRDLLSANVRLRDLVRYTLLAAFNAVMRRHWRGRPYPYMRGRAGSETPSETLNLTPGELVQVRTKEEIMGTLDDGLRNRGLKFDAEMVPYCGRTFRVLRKVERIVDEKSGRLVRIPTPCLVLEGVTCGGCLSSNRLFCPRAIYPYWHEIWLKRVAPAPINDGGTRAALV